MSAAAAHSAPARADCYIGGSPRSGTEWVTRENPAHPEREAARVAVADAPMVADAVTAARSAGAEWAGTGITDRCAALRRALDAVTPHAEQIAGLLARELGKPLRDCLTEFRVATEVIRSTVEQAAEVLCNVTGRTGGGRLEVRRRPYGVIAAIVPWNAPLVLAATKLAPALAAGNTVVLKPSPVAGAALGLFLATLGDQLPPGVLNVAHGDATTGDALVNHPQVRRIAFTGGLAAGAQVMAAAARRAVPVTMELGGNDAAIVLDDADLSPEAMARAVMATFRTSGQVCMAAKRWYVHHRILPAFIEAYREAASRCLVVGDPLDETVTMGPLATAGQRDRVQALTDDAVRRGGQLLRVGRIADEDLVSGGGYFLPPALVLGAADDWPLVTEEQFGPVAPILPFQDVDEVIVRANATEFGLGSSIWTSDEDRAFALAARLDAGYTFVNTHNLDGLALTAPFGGVRASGFGREFGAAGLLEFSTTHAVHRPPHVVPRSEK